MKVLKGGSAEVRSNQWKKFDIELDESDLQAIVIKHKLDYSKLTVVQKFRILSLQAEVFVTYQMESEGMTGEKSTGALSLELRNFLETLPKAEDAASV